MDEPKKPLLGPAQTTQLTLAIICGLVAIWGLDNFIDANASDRTIKLFLGVAMVLFGGLGCGLNLWAFLRNRQSK